MLTVYVLTVIMLTVIMMTVIMLTFIMLIVHILSVIAPFHTNWVGVRGSPSTDRATVLQGNPY